MPYQTILYAMSYATRRASCNKSDQQVSSYNNLLKQADVRMCSHGLRQLVDKKSVASCQQTCCKLIDKTCYPQACCKLFQQIVKSLQMTMCRAVLCCGTSQLLFRLVPKEISRAEPDYLKIHLQLTNEFLPSMSYHTK